MKNLRSSSLLLLTSLIAHSAFAAEDGDLNAVRACLNHWGKHPFSEKSPKYRTMAAKVKVLGIGSETTDSVITDEPSLILVKPNVNVLSKASLSLLNPKGWYCLKGQVSVLGKSEVTLHCQAKMASSNDGATVMGGSDTDQGVTVLGSTRLIRVGCPTSKE